MIVILCNPSKRRKKKRRNFSHLEKLKNVKKFLDYMRSLADIFLVRVCVCVLFTSLHSVHVNELCIVLCK